MVAGKLHSIPRTFLNVFAAIHSFTPLKIVVVRVVRSFFFSFSNALSKQEAHNEMYVTPFHFSPISDQITPAATIKVQSSYVATLDHSASSHPQQAPITGEVRRYLSAWVLRMRFVSTSEGHGHETRHVLSIQCSTVEANRAHDTNVARMGQMHHTANLWVNSSH